MGRGSLSDAGQSMFQGDQPGDALAMSGIRARQAAAIWLFSGLLIVEGTPFGGGSACGCV